MAVIKAKRSVHPSKVVRRNDRLTSTRHPDRSGSSAERRNQIRSSTPAKRSTQPRRSSSKFTYFPEVQGKVVKELEYYADSGVNALSVMFQDNTCLIFNFATGLATEAHFSRWKDGNERVLKYWPRIYCDPAF